MTRYPAAYRGSASARAGLSTPRAAGAPGVRFPVEIPTRPSPFWLPDKYMPKFRWEVPLPANDGLPANDNIPDFGDGDDGPGGRGPRFPRWVRIGGRFLGWVGLGLTAYEIYQWATEEEWVPWWSDELGDVDLSQYNLVCTSTPATVFGNASNGYCAWPEPLGTFYSHIHGLPSCGDWSVGCVTEHEVPDGDHVGIYKNQYWDGIDWFGRVTHRTIEVWERKAVYTSPAFRTTQARPAGFYPGVGTPVPSLNPEGLPILKPAPTPRPKPWPARVAPPGTQPRTEPRTRPAPGFAPGVRTRPSIRPNLPPLRAPVTIVPPVVDVPGTGPVPVQPVPVQVEPSPGTQPPRVTVPTKPPSISSEAPKKGTKERKVTVRTAAGASWVVIGGFTEMLDFVNVLWQAIPKDKRTGGRPSQAQKFRDLYANWEDIDVASAVAGYINNQLEDFTYGQIGRATGRANRNLDISTGTGRAVRGDRGDAQDEGFLPELTYDPETGEWGLDWSVFGL